LGRSILLLTTELLANAICWIAAGILFGGREDTRGLLSLAILAWTLGLRHALDADHISAIDNATRGLLNLGQLTVTCGLFFSLGHSTIVIAVIVAIAISTDVYDKINGVSDVGGVIGAAVSASFLFIVGLANSIILYKILQRRRRRRARVNASTEESAPLEPVEHDPAEDNRKDEKTLMLRLLGPMINFVDRPWKMYPVGVLFGLGFDTASSIALLAVSALAKNGTKNGDLGQGTIVIFPFLFTAGMTLIDSVDSVLMIHSYAGFPEQSWALIKRRKDRGKQRVALVHPNVEDATARAETAVGGSDDTTNADKKSPSDENPQVSEIEGVDAVSLRDDVPLNVDTDDDVQRRIRIKQTTMSNLSIILTVISIVVAFTISFITIMGLIADNCKPCKDAADAEDGGGLAGSWWRFWDNANDAIGFIGAGIVGVFVLVVIGWYIGVWIVKKRRLRAHDQEET